MAESRDTGTPEHRRSLFTRRRSARRCVACGGEVAPGDDFVHLRGEVLHNDCAVHRYGGAAPPKGM